MKAIRNTEGKKREEWKESMGRELRGLIDCQTYDVFLQRRCQCPKVQNVPARIIDFVHQPLPTMVPNT
eukprot:2242581-Amphidinium_carterae.1